MHILDDNDPVFARHAPLTVGSVSKALADSREAIESTRALADDVDDIDALIESIEKKSGAETRALLKALDTKFAAHDAEMAKLRATQADDFAKLRAAPDILQKALDWEREFFRKQWAASGSNVDFEVYMQQIEYERELIAKRAESEAEYDAEEISNARFESRYRVVN